MLTARAVGRRERGNNIAYCPNSACKMAA